MFKAAYLRQYFGIDKKSGKMLSMLIASHFSLLAKTWLPPEEVRFTEKTEGDAPRRHTPLME